MIHVDDMPGVNDFEKIGEAIALAHKTSRPKNGTVTIHFAERDYLVHAPLVFSNHLFLKSEGSGRRSTQIKFTNPQSGQSLLTMLGNNAGGLSGIAIQARANNLVHNVIGLHVIDCGSCVFRDYEVQVQSLGLNSCGVQHERRRMWGESNTFERFDVRAARPFVLLSGDNLSVSKFDITCLGDVDENHVSSIFQGGPTTTPDHWVISEGTGQGGDHAFYIRSTVNRVGSGLAINDYRWEQGTQTDKAAWVVDINRTSNGTRRHALELLNMSGCRHPQRDHSTEFKGIMKETIDGNFLPGTPI